MSVRTLSDLIFHVRDISTGHPDLLTVRMPARREAVSATDFLRNVHSLALALEARGLAKGDRVAIYSESRPEWHVADFACQLLGAPTVPLIPASPARQVGFIIRNSGCRWIFYSDAVKRDLLAELMGAVTSPPQAVAFDADAAMAEGMSITRLIGEGAERRGEIPIERFRGRVAEEDLASLLYTSGTTGDPKGVMLSHRNLVSNFLACDELFDDLGPQDLAVSFLPLSHGVQRTLDHLCFYRGASIHYVPTLEDVPRALREERPTLLVAVPRIIERTYQSLREDLRAESAWRRRLTEWSVAIGERHAAASRSGFVGPLLALERQLAEALVFRRIRRRFGGRLRYAISGGGALAPEVSEFFEAVGLPLYQGYGLTETSPVLASSGPDQQRQGSVGKPLSDVELRVAEDGEILARGPGVMQGYWANPGGTAASFDESGWLFTGDVGRIDQSGYLFITDRKEHLLVLSGGETVAPQPIEKLIVSRAAGLLRAVVVGDGHPHVGALLVPDFEPLREELGEQEAGALAEHPELVGRVEAAIDKINEELVEHARVRRFKLLDSDFSVEEEELTPTFQIRRKTINRRWADEIAALCSADELPTG
ncbi:MAG: long-chain fatty acid--CoA ligase [Thermoanaerobaculia bacterium]